MRGRFARKYYTFLKVKSKKMEPLVSSPNHTIITAYNYRAVPLRIMFQMAITITAPTIDTNIAGMLSAF